MEFHKMVLFIELLTLYLALNCEHFCGVNSINQCFILESGLHIICTDVNTPKT